MNVQVNEPTKSFDLFYKYKTVSVDHLQELQEYIDELKQGDKLSDNETYRSYIKDMKFAAPEKLPAAKSIIVMATYTKPMLVNFHLNGNKHEVIVPPQYYMTGLSEEILRDVIMKEIIKGPGYRIERSTNVHLKLLAVRSGLARYGRNNITYVDGMGSMIALYSFFTDFQFEEDNWNEIRMLSKCENCRICMNRCPGNCIREDNFVIDVNKCVTLYNEIDGEFPEQISPDAHNALFGCMKCQSPCPANREVINQTGRLEDITEEETRNILEGNADKELQKSAYEKLKLLTDSVSIKYYSPVVTRNLGVLIDLV